MTATRLKLLGLISISGLADSLAACAETSNDPVVLGDGGSTDAGLPGDAGDGAAPECTIYDEGSTRSCSCGTSTGTQACFSGAYSACKCAPADAGVSTGTLCKAGFYRGEFTGKYKPGAFGLGLFMSFFEVDIQGKAVGNYPALSFTLSQQNEGGGEFASFSVNGGCMVGSAAAYGTDNPFVARLTGSLDCKTGMFSGSITGNYTLLSIQGATFNFTGPLSAQFELPQTLKDGVWNVKEPASLSGEPAGGGGGMWSANWDSDAPPAGEDPCAALGDVGASDGGTATAADASTGSTSDAGVRDASP